LPPKTYFEGYRSSAAFHVPGHLNTQHAMGLSVVSLE